jgi:hypothetical protein
MSKTVSFDVLALAKAEGFDETGRKIKKLGDDSKRDMHLLSTAIADLAPALAPIGAAAVAAGAGLVGLGAVGLLAFGGIKREMAAGTPIGKQYTAMVSELKNDLHGLEATAAKGVLSGFQAGVAALRPLMPAVTRDTQVLSGQLGAIASHVMPALVSLFLAFNPLLTQFGGDLARGSAGFERWAQSSTGVSKFVLYAQSELPKVEHVLGEVGGAVGHIVASLGPLGGVSLTSIGVLAQIVARFPVGVITALATAFALFRTASLGLGVLKTVADNLGKVSAAAGKMGYSSSGAAAGFGLMGGAGLIAGGALFGLTTIMGEASAKAQRLTQDTQDYTQALQDSHGAITQAVDDTVLQKAVQDGSTQIFAKAGITVNQWVDAVEHGGKTYDDLRGKLLHSVGPASLLNNKLYEQRKAFENGQTAQQGYTAGQAALGAAADKSTPQMKQMQQQIDSIRGSALSATAVLGDWNNAVAELSGNAVTAEQDELHLKDAMAALTGQVRTNGRELGDNTAKGRANKLALLDLITQANAHSAAVLQQTGSVTKATGALRLDEGQIRRSATAAGLNKKQVDQLIHSYEAVPSDVSTKVNADIKSAKTQIKTIETQLATLQLKYGIINIQAYVRQVILPDVRSTYSQHAAGGQFTEGWNLYGEHGPEWAYKSGSSVQMYPTGTAPAGLRGGGVVLEIRSGGSKLDDLLVEIIRRSVRVRGGNVQVALGRG